MPLMGRNNCCIHLLLTVGVLSKGESYLKSKVDIYSKKSKVDIHVINKVDMDLADIIVVYSGY